MEEKKEIHTFQSPLPFAGRFLNPEKLLKQAELIPGMAVAHFGCSLGYFTFPMAEKVGKGGTVWALDVLTQKVEKVKQRARLTGITNIFARVANLEEKRGSGLADGSIDRVVMINMLYQNSHKFRIIDEAKRVLKDSGHIILVDWKAEIKNRFIGPEQKDRVSKKEIIRIVRKDSLAIIKDAKVSDFHYCLILKK